MERERETMANMMEIYCADKHGSTELCADCRELLQYATARLDRCPNAENKPTCNKCTIHCYDPAHRERIKAVMRYAGPRMLLRHPVQAIRHLADERKTPTKKTI
jgi:predicted amidophosphoribosyltransferase